MESAGTLYLCTLDILVGFRVVVLHRAAGSIRLTWSSALNPCRSRTVSAAHTCCARAAFGRCAWHTRTELYSTVCLCRCGVLNGAFLGVVVYSLFYTGLEQFAGITWCLSTGIPCWLTATAFSQHVPHAWAYAIGVHILSWWAQIHLGHIMLEHRKPALLDSFFQAMTPLHAMPCHATHLHHSFSACHASLHCL